MKHLRLLISIALLQSVLLTATAQNRPFKPAPRNEFSVNVGVWPVMPNTSAAYDDCDFFTPVDANFQFMHHASKRFSIGFDFSYSPIMQDGDTYCYDCEQQTKNRRSDNLFNRGNNYTGSIIIVMPTVRMEWIKNSGFSLYSRAAFGVGIQTGTSTGDCTLYGNRNNQPAKSSTHCGFAYQLTPIGLTFGREIFCRLEFPSFGYEGLASIGLGYRF